MGDLPISPSLELRESWKSFVAELVQPELAIDVLLFGTFTFADWVSQDGVSFAPGLRKGRRAINCFIERVNEYVDAFVIVEERGKQNDRLHYHCLLRCDRSATFEGLLLPTLLKLWTAGYSKLEPARGIAEAISYSTKYVLKGQYAGELGFWAKRSTRVRQMSMSLKSDAVASMGR